MQRLIPALDRFPRRRKLRLGDRIRTTAPSVPERLAEATFTRDRPRWHDRTDTDFDKLRMLLRLSKHLARLDARRCEHACRLRSGTPMVVVLDGEQTSNERRRLTPARPRTPPRCGSPG